MKSPYSVHPFILLLSLLPAIPLFPQNPILSHWEIQEDFHFLCEKTETIHPNIHQHYPVEEYNNRKETIRRTFPDSMSVEDFYLTIAPFIAKIKDGHTNIQPVASPNRMRHLQSGGKTTPVRIVTNDGCLLVKYLLTDEKTPMAIYDTIISINNVSSKDICNYLYSLLASEKGVEITDAYLEPYISTLLWYKYQWENEFNFILKGQNGFYQASLQGVSNDTALAYIRELNAQQAETNSYSFQPDPITHSGYIQIKTFTDPPSIGNFLEKTFAEIKQNHITELTIDIQNNPGGTSRAVDSLVFYLTDEPYQTYQSIRLKVSQEVKERYAEIYPEIYEQIRDMKNGDIYTYPSTYQKSDKENIYTGKLTILCNKSTYSAASTFVSIIKNLQRGTVTGETGQESHYYGDMLFFQLPHSGINFHVSMKEFDDQPVKPTT